jgi:hypothetical protein
MSVILVTIALRRTKYLSVKSVRVRGLVGFPLPAKKPTLHGVARKTSMVSYSLDTSAMTHILDI